MKIHQALKFFITELILKKNEKTIKMVVSP